jgi:AraC family transcriptional regulator
MPVEQALRVDYKKADEIAQVLPTLPVFTSHRSAWRGLEFQYHQQPAAEMPESQSSHHIIAVHHHQNPIFCEQRLDGHRQVAKVENKQITMVPANLVYQTTWHHTIAATVLVLDPQYLAKIAGESVDADRVELIPIFAQDDPIIYQISALLQAEVASADNSSQIYADSLITALSAHLLRQYCTVEQVLKHYEGGLSQYKLKQSIDYIQAHLAEDISLDDIAAQVGMSRYYFCQLFKRSTGMSPYQYVIKCRIDRAKELLLFRQDCSIADVAFQVGFASQSQFTKHFKKWVGTTPKKF